MIFAFGQSFRMGITPSTHESDDNVRLATTAKHLLLPNRWAMAPIIFLATRSGYTIPKYVLIDFVNTY